MTDEKLNVPEGWPEEHECKRCSVCHLTQCAIWSYNKARKDCFIPHTKLMSEKELEIARLRDGDDETHSITPHSQQALKEQALKEQRHDRP